MKIAVLSPCFLQFCVYARPATFEISDKEGVFFFLVYYAIIINIQH